MHYFSIHICVVLAPLRPDYPPDCVIRCSVLIISGEIVFVAFLIEKSVYWQMYLKMEVSAVMNWKSCERFVKVCKEAGVEVMNNPKANASKERHDRVA